MPRPRVPGPRWVTLIALGLVAGALRAFDLGEESLWLDEATTVLYVRRWGPVQLLANLPEFSPHPPLYFLLAEFWTTLFGTSEVAIRSLSAAFGVGAVLALYGLALALYDRRTAFVSALIAALSSFQLYFSQEARMYSLMGLLSVLSFLAFVRIHQGGGRAWLAGYVLATAALLYTHVLAVVVVAAQAVFVAYVRLFGARDRPGLRTWSIAGAGVGIAFLPWGLLVLRKVFLTVGGDSPVAWNAPPSLVRLAGTPVSYLGDPRIFLHDHPLAVVAGLALLVAGLPLLPAMVRDLAPPQPTPRAERFALLGSWLLVPVVSLAVLAYTVAPVYAIRYTIASSFAMYVLLARGLLRVEVPWRRAAVGLLLVAALVAPLPTYYGADQKEQWDEVATHLEAAADEEDVIILTDGYVERPFAYYFDRETVAVHALPASAPPARFRSAAAGHDTVWLLTSHVTPAADERIAAVLQSRRSSAPTPSYVGLELYRFRAENGSATNASDGRAGRQRTGPVADVG